ncbi:MAG: DUF4369 domain-containing protein, partial [Flavisolibacter sp.]|nr:DUF4369 domain-containing protein [Flavisolibacter sp.]
MRIPATVLLLALSLLTLAQEGYNIKITLKPFRNQYVYLGHYYGKQLPIIDSVKLNEKSEGVFKGSKKLGGGIYLIGYPDRAHNFEILIDKNQHFSIIADTAHIAKLTFQGSPENIAFVAYQDFMLKNGRAIDSLSKLNSAGSEKESKVSEQIKTRQQVIKKYREDVIQKQPDGLLATLLKAMKEPEIPTNAPVAKGDSLFAYKYY